MYNQNNNKKKTSKKEDVSKTSTKDYKYTFMVGSVYNSLIYIFDFISNYASMDLIGLSYNKC